MSVVDTRTLPWSWYTDPAAPASNRSASSAAPGSTSGTRARSRSRGRSPPPGRPTSRLCSFATRRASCAPSSTSAATGARWSARTQGGGRPSSVPTTPGRTGSTDGSSPRPAPSARAGSSTTASGSSSYGWRAGARSCSSTPILRPPLADLLGDVPDRIAAAGLDVQALRFLHRDEKEYEANWKVCAENFLECYHCPTAHPGFSAVMDVSPDVYLLEAHGPRMSQHAPPRPEPRGSYDPSGEVERGQFHLLFPGTVVNVMAGRPNLSIGPIVPLAPERTHRFLDYFVAPDADDAWIEEMLEFDGQVGAEDRVLVERVQRGVRSGLLDEGRLLPESERLVAHFQSLVVDALA